MLVALFGTSFALGQPHPVFESGPVRPLALSPDGSRLFVVNIPDARLEVFEVGAAGLKLAESVAVGLEPVAVAARTNNEVWVVNHLSDSVSVVALDPPPARVVRTLLVGDEPRDIVFAGPGRDRAFITAAHRGQNLPMDPALRTPGLGRADVWVFDANQLGTSLGGDPLAILTLFGDTPRALAVSPDGAVVYAAVFHSGNQTSIVPELAVCEGGPDAPPCEVAGLQMPGGMPAPVENREGVPAPKTGLIVKYDAESDSWRDVIGRNWNNAVPFRLTDEDVFVLDAMASPPQLMGSIRGAGTIIYGMAVNPVSGVLYVSNTEARNDVRFEPNVRAHAHESRITVIAGNRAMARQLNKHIDYSVVPSPPGIKQRSLALPLDMAVSGDGSTLYVAAFGSSKIGVFSANELEADTFVPTDNHIDIAGGGPAGIVLDEDRGRLYVLSRFANEVVVIDLESRAERQRVRLHSPEPPSVVEGRRFLYDAVYTSSNGEMACASCHVFADFDSLAWDLGDPEGVVQPNPLPIHQEGSGERFDFHPMKGPMTTQTLRGLATHGAMHWRGDRVVPDDPFDARGAFLTFNATFVRLMGREQPLRAEEMEAFASFVLQIVPPPNPIRALDNSLTPAQAQGRALFTPPTGECSGCHVLKPELGFFGTNGFAATNVMQASQTFKVPHLRNVYQKVGRYFAAGPQVRGFGLLHNGSGSSDLMQNEAIEFLFAFDSNFAPIVGQQITAGLLPRAVTDPRLDLFVGRAAAGECDLVVKAGSGSSERGWLLAGGAFLSDTGDESIPERALRDLAQVDGPFTYTCVPPGSGRRLAIDRDGDGVLDGEERRFGSNPADPDSVPLPTPTPAPCAGDCNSDRQVRIDELVTAVALALGEPVGQCAAADGDRNGAITIDELISAVRSALEGC